MKKSMIKKAAALLILVGCVGIAYVVFATTADVTGYACSPNIGCISLNNQTSAGEPGFSGQPATFSVQYDDVAKTFSGSGWAPSVGTVNFGLPCPSNIITAEGPAANGNKCASVPLAQGGAGSLGSGGWIGYIYMGNVVLAADQIHFTGKGWEGLDTNQDGYNPSDVGVGWLDFSDAIWNGPSTPPPAAGVCGSATVLPTNTQPTNPAYLCSVGTPNPVPPSGTNPWHWTCTGTDNNPIACHTTPLSPGYCGLADGSTVSSLTATDPNLCVSGPANAFTSTASGWTWTCSGSPCSATLIVCTNPGGCINPPGGPIKPIYKEN